jgi:hypothetical protein
MVEQGEVSVVYDTILPAISKNVGAKISITIDITKKSLNFLR